jgi:transcriptional regulator with XRE-family HTH domain
MAAKKKKPVQKLPFVKLEAVLGQVVARRRQELGMAQGDLAKKLGVSPGTASRIEGGQVVSLDQLWLLARALDMPASGLLAAVEQAVRVLREGGVDVKLRKEPAPRKEGVEFLTGAGLAGVLGFLLAKAK